MKFYGFRVSPEEKELIEWLEELKAKNELSNTIRVVLKFVKNNGLEELQTYDSLKIQKLRVDIEYKKYQTEFLKLRMKYDYEFDSKPSKAAVTAMKTKAADDSGYEAPEIKTIDNLIEKKWNRFVSEMRMMKDGWKIVCKLCQVGYLNHKTKESAIARFKLHLNESHERELIEIEQK